MNLLLSWVAFESASACCWPVLTCAVGRHHRPEVAHDLLGGDALAGGDEDRVVLAALAQQRLRGRHVEYGDRRAADRVDAAVAGDAGDRVLPHRAREPTTPIRSPTA